MQTIKVTLKSIESDLYKFVCNNEITNDTYCLQIMTKEQEPFLTNFIEEFADVLLEFRIEPINDGYWVKERSVFEIPIKFVAEDY